jgi:hypothetical protein
MRLRPALPLLAALCACSGSNGTPDAGPADAGDPLAILGLTLNHCFEYTSGSTAQTMPALGAAVESDSVTAIEYLADGGSSTGPAVQLIYRVNGQPAMEDFLKVEGRDLYLLKRTVPGAETVEYKPAVMLVRLPLKNGDHLDQMGQDREYTSSTATPDQPYDLTFNVLAAPVNTPAGSYDAGYQVAYVENPTHNRLNSWTFVPGVGPVQVVGAMAGDLPDGGQLALSYSLQNQRTLAAGSVCSSGQ